MKINNWDLPEVTRAETTWGQITPPYSVDMFNFTIANVSSWLDLGCGFGRFLNYLTNSVEDPDYIGYDSSPSMIARIKERFPHYSNRLFLKNITDPIVHQQASIICSAVLIHITIEDQNRVLNNIKAANPTKFAFDINCPNSKTLAGRTHFYKFIKGAESSFRMTWQPFSLMRDKVQSLFPNYNLTTKTYDLKADRHKTVFFLER